MQRSLSIYRKVHPFLVIRSTALLSCGVMVCSKDELGVESGDLWEGGGV